MERSGRSVDHAAHTRAGASAGITPHHSLGIEPIAASSNNPSLVFDWRPVDIETSGSYTCTITVAAHHPLTLTIDQPPYLKTLHGMGSLTIAAIPPGSLGTQGRLVVRDDAAEASAEFTWTWHARGVGGDARLPSPTAWARVSALVKQIAARASGQNPTSATLVEATAHTETPLISSASPFDGEWYSIGSFESFSMKIVGTIGICTRSNAPFVMAVGDTCLYMDTQQDRSFWGRQFYLDGKFRPVSGTLIQHDCLKMIHIGPDRDCVQNWKMNRR